MKTFRQFGIDVPDVFIGEKQTTCPKCSESRKKKRVKCLSANGTEGVWYCHHCGWTGTLKEGTRTKSQPYYYKPLRKKVEYKRSNLPEKVIKWFKERGITEKTLTKNEIGYGSVYMPQVEDFVNAIKFPYRKNGSIVNIKYRDGKKNFRQETGAEKIFYKLNDIDGKDEIIITEGEIDALSFDECGLNAVSVPNGAPSVKTKNYESIFDYLEQIDFERIKKVYLAVDNDEPGIKLENELARRIGKEKCWRFVYPDGCKDPNDVLVKYGVDILLDCYKNAAPYPISGLVEPSSIKKELKNLYQTGLLRGESTGWGNLNEHYRIKAGQQTVVTGMPGHGKSSFIDALAVNLAERNDWKFAVFTPESLPLERHMSWLMSRYIKKPFDKGWENRINEVEYFEAFDFVNEHFKYIMPDDDNFKVDNILDLAKKSVFRYGVKGIIIDPWNQMDHTRPTGMTETEFIGQTLTKTSLFAKLHDVHIWIIAHPRKMEKRADGSYPVVSPYDISGSSNWWNKADNCISIYQDVSDNRDVRQVHIQKIRFRAECGEPGMIELKYNRPTGCFSC